MLTCQRVVAREAGLGARGLHDGRMLLRPTRAVVLVALVVAVVAQPLVGVARSAGGFSHLAYRLRMHLHPVGRVRHRRLVAGQAERVRMTHLTVGDVLCGELTVFCWTRL